jgi:cold shock CspA family protein/ribosome-associated translation inhibitor RaiA
MQIPLQITFHGMGPSAAIETAVRDRVAHLERFHPRITRCHVTVDEPHRHQRKGRMRAVRIDITTPTGEIAVSRGPHHDASHEDFNAVLRDAFAAAARQLEDEVRRRRGDVKTHDNEALRGRVVRLFPLAGYGFLVTPDDLEVYFHENSVFNDRFGDLTVGAEVRFTLADTESPKGPQASTVHLVR